jgi:hypothetical protein
VSETRIISQNNVLGVLQAKYREEMNTQADHVAGGACKNFPEYTHHTGIIYGLALAERMLLDLHDKIEAED